MKSIVSKEKAIEPKPLRGVVDDGTSEIPLVNKFDKVICKIYIRPADWSILDRYNAFTNDFESIVKPLADMNIKNDGTAEFDKDWAVLKAVEDEIKHRFDKLFDMEEADEIFKNRNAFSSVGGEFFCYRVLMALAGVIEDAIQEEAELSKARVAKYLTSKKNEGVKDAGVTTKKP